MKLGAELRKGQEKGTNEKIACGIKTGTGISSLDAWRPDGSGKKANPIPGSF